MLLVCVVRVSSLGRTVCTVEVWEARYGVWFGLWLVGCWLVVWLLGLLGWRVLGAFWGLVCWGESRKR